MIAEFNLTPVVLVRNLDDCVASIRDHARQQPGKTYSWFPQHLSEMTDGDLEGYIVDFLIPWYVQFEVSWQKCPSAIWVHYDDVRTNTAQVLQRISRAARISAADPMIDAAVQSAVTRGKRFNMGVSGRGHSIAPYARERIRSLLERYPHHQFRSAPGQQPQSAQ